MDLVVEIRKEINNGKTRTGVFDILRDNGFMGTYREYFNLCIDNDIKFPGRKRVLDKEVRERIIDDEINNLGNLTYQSVAEREVEETPWDPVCIEAIRQYLIRNNRMEEWKAAIERKKFEKKNKPKERKRLVDMLTFRWAKLQGRAYEETVKFYHLHPKSRRDPSPVFKLFDAYFKAKEEGIRLSCRDFERITGMSGTSCVRYIIDHGLEPMYWKCKPHKRIAEVMKTTTAYREPEELEKAKGVLKNKKKYLDDYGEQALELLPEAVKLATLAEWEEAEKVLE